MRMAKLFGRTTWGAMSAGCMAALLLMVSGPASAQGIADTRHNLGSGAGPAGRNTTTNTAEVCVFCHTPHGGATTSPVPLWNKRLGAEGVPGGGGSYTTYDTLQLPSLDGTVAPVGSISLACLSCHDGTQAMDNVINAPGSGGFLADGGGTDGRAWAWTGPTVDTATGRMTNAGDRISMLGTDLSNDHPIGIQYCGGGLSGTGAAISGTCRDSDFTLPQTQVVNGNQVFWVETGGAGKQRTDMPLYQRATGGLGPLVECASCHDPHVATGQAGPPTTGRVSGETFLRVSNAESAVCRACHVK
jgi:hypothetical protein